MGSFLFKDLFTEGKFIRGKNYLLGGRRERERERKTEREKEREPSICCKWLYLPGLRQIEARSLELPSGDRSPASESLPAGSQVCVSRQLDLKWRRQNLKTVNRRREVNIPKQRVNHGI